jgi:hypothetical protein
VPRPFGVLTGAPPEAAISDAAAELLVI